MAELTSYHIGKDLYHAHPHHESFEKLWNLSWKRPATMGIYPFMCGSIQDFQPVADGLIGNKAGEPWEWDEYANAFIAPAEKLVAKAEQALQTNEKDKASEFFLRASALYRIGRFPIPRSERQKLAWSRGKDAFLRGNALTPHPIEDVNIPHIHGLSHEGKAIETFVSVPATQSLQPTPVVLLLCGLDGYRTELVCNAEPMRLAGIALVIAEIPGTGDSPADPSDPESFDRQLDSMLDWIDGREDLDSARVAIWAVSTGGLYAVRAAHLRPSRLLGTVCRGGGVHHMFDEAWLNEVDHLEYPFE